MKKSFLFFVIIFQISVLAYAAPIPAPISQGERFVLLNRYGKNVCVHPYKSGWTLYASLDYVGNRLCLTAPAFTFDVLGRITTQIEKNWWCLRAPNSTDVETSYDYVTLEPCITNDPYQYWQYKNGKLQTAVNGYQLGEINWTLAVAKNTSKIYSFSLGMKDTNKWINENAQAQAGLAFQMPMYWKDKNSTRYNLVNGRYSSTPYYDPETGHIYRRETQTTFLCLRSKQIAFTPTADWNWTDWISCTSKDQDKELKWTLFSRSKAEAFSAHDEDGNILRVGTTGPSWGSLYTINPKKVKSYTRGTPLAVFTTDEYFNRYRKQELANLLRVQRYCPSPGQQPTTASSSFNRTPRSLPPHFQLSHQWISRFFALARTSGNITIFPNGICGACFVQAIEMLSEMYRSPTLPPISTEPGIWFNPGSLDILQTYQYRMGTITMGMLQDEFERIAAYYGQLPDEIQGQVRMDVLLSTLQTILPHFDIGVNQRWDLPNPFHSPVPPEIYENMVSLMLRGNIGSTYFFEFEFVDEQTNINAVHAMLAIRTSNGIHFLPTTIPQFISLEQYDQAVNTNVVRGEHLREALLTAGFLTPPPYPNYIRQVRIVELTQFYPYLPNSVMSASGCNFPDPFTGGFGNGRRLTGTTVNQCGMGGGKCDQSNPMPR